MQEDNQQELSEESGSEPEGSTSQMADAGEVDLLRGKLAELETSLNQYKDQFLRKAAEFENYKKRVENDSAAMIRFSNEDLIQKLLPVLDDFERMIKANKHNQEATSDDAFMKGVELIYSKFKKILEALGVREFEVVGKPFNPELHDALMQMPREGVPSHTVLEEVEKGYMLHDKVIRHARVIVSAEAS